MLSLLLSTTSLLSPRPPSLLRAGLPPQSGGEWAGSLEGATPGATPRLPSLLSPRPPSLLRVGVQPHMASGAAGVQQVDGVRVGPPPDLPSLLLNNRIVYVGLPLVPSVTELVVAQLLYLNYETKEKPVYMCVHGRTSGGRSESERVSERERNGEERVRGERGVS